jgi:hypothetical protein
MRDTKIAKVAQVLRSRRAGLNRFEAESWGEHCLNSTIAVLRQQGLKIIDQWERVPTRFGTTARVKRYRYVGSEQ